MANNDAGLFALVDDVRTPVRRIPLTADLKRQISSLFSEQHQNLLNNKKSIEFSGSYNVDHDEIFLIRDYPLPETVSQAVSNPLNCQNLDLGVETHNIKALFSGVWTDELKQINFQRFDSGKLLKQGFTLIGRGDTYRKLEDPGLILQDKLTAYFKDGSLFFVSYHNTKRFLDLSKYYREATDTDLDAFASSELFAFEDQASF